MNDRDDELDALLKPLRASNPSDSQIITWKRAVENETRIKVFKITKSRMVLQMAAAMLLGILIGGALFKEMGKKNGEFEVVTQNFHSNATFEYSHANLD